MNVGTVVLGKGVFKVKGQVHCRNFFNVLFMLGGGTFRSALFSGFTALFLLFHTALEQLRFLLPLCSAVTLLDVKLCILHRLNRDVKLLGSKGLGAFFHAFIKVKQQFSLVLCRGNYIHYVFLDNFFLFLSHFTAAFLSLIP